MRAVVYTRISSDRSGAGEGVARQRADAEDLAQRRGWTVSRVHEDNDVSASGKRVRPQFEEMLKAVGEGGVSAIVAWNLDRLTRNRRDTVRLIELCQEHQVTIALVRGSDLDMSTPSGRLVADVLASVARAEIETKGERQKRANLQRASAGKPHAGRRAFGYSQDGREIVQDEAQPIREAFEAIERGASLRSIVRQWNAAGLTSTAGNPWRPDSVRGVLKNHRYAGRRVYHGDDMAEGEWPAIVDVDTALAVRALLSAPSRSTASDRSIKFLLTSIAECGRCDDGSVVATARTQHGVRVYKCTSRADVARGAEPIDELVSELVIARLSAPDARLADFSEAADLGSIRAEIDTQTGLQASAADLFAAGSITAPQLLSITERTRARLVELEDSIVRASSGSTVARLVAAPDIRNAWDAAPIKAKREVIKALFARIVVDPVPRGTRTFDPESVRIEWRQA